MGDWKVYFIGQDKELRTRKSPDGNIRQMIEKAGRQVPALVLCKDYLAMII